MAQRPNTLIELVRQGDFLLGQVSILGQVCPRPAGVDHETPQGGANRLLCLKL